MLSALIAAALYVNQDPPMSEEAVVREAHKLIDVFDLGVVLWKIERDPKSELADGHVVFQSHGGGLYRVSVNTDARKAHSVQVIEEYVGPTASVIGEATAKEIKYALGIMRKTHPSNKVVFWDSMAFVIPDGRTRVSVTGKILFDDELLYVGSEFYVRRRRPVGGFIPSYGLTVAQLEFDRVSGKPVRYFHSNSDYAFDLRPPIANLTAIRFAARKSLSSTSRQ